ncbi:MAG: hypothetical protein JO168_12750 [Solirubrobacterales bacterium]|nr:hypothetical protein [Solirubrobacterales bacterium]MBV9715187.1 hypothetical protein [Solirubrobacterales bacterium]
MLVTRGEDDRLSGNVRSAAGGDAHEFSGTLELLRVFEELVPAERSLEAEGEPRR